jgi:hypothetical protein
MGESIVDLEQTIRQLRTRKEKIENALAELEELLRMRRARSGVRAEKRGRRDRTAAKKPEPRE